MSYIKNEIKNINLRKIKNLLTSKSFIGSFIIAVALWAYSSLNSEFRPYISIPLKIILPKSYGMEKDPPSKVLVKVKGSGWSVIYLKYFNTSSKCVIDLSDKKLEAGEVQINRNDMLKGVEYIQNVELLDVSPENVQIYIGKLSNKKVPIRQLVYVYPRAGFIQTSIGKLSPDSVIITGNSKVIESITHWDTIPLEIKNVYQPFSVQLQLSDTLSNIIVLSQNQTTTHIDIQQTAEMVFYDQEVKIVGGGSMPKEQKLTPQRVTVTIRGGIDQLASLSGDVMNVYINYSDIVRDSIGILKPIVQLNDTNIKVISVSPRFIYHFRTYNSLVELSKQ